jgi:hypothetical protein
MRVINIKLDTGKTIMDAKSNKGSEGCLLNAMPIILLTCRAYSENYRV